MSLSDVNVYPNIASLLSSIIKKIPLQKNFLDKALSSINEKELLNFEHYLLFCKNSGLSTEYLTECYMTIVSDTLEEQIYFQKHKKYRNSSFDDVSSSVYFDKDYMSKYMYGLAISGFFWPNHMEMYRFFFETIPKNKTGNYLEIGPGHGSYMMQALKHSKYTSFTGIDISEASIGLTEKILSHFCLQEMDKCKLICLDFLDSNLPKEKYDAVVMGEVLEHVERPEIFLSKIYDIAKTDAYIFVTTCINAPAIDHIYLYNNVFEVEEMIRQSGLVINKSLILPYEGKSLEECESRKLSINVAYELTKAS